MDMKPYLLAALASVNNGSVLQAPSIDWKGAQAGRFGPGGYLGVTSVPLPGSSPAHSELVAERRQREKSVQVWDFSLWYPLHVYPGYDHAAPSKW